MLEFGNKEQKLKKILEECNFYNVIDEFLSFIEYIGLTISQHYLEVKNNTIRICNNGFISSELTIKGILKLCEIGDVVDSFILLRKIRDNILLDYFFINDYINNVPKYENKEIVFKSENIDEMVEYLAKYIVEKNNYDASNEEKQIIDKWFKTENNDKRFQNTFKYSNYKKSLNESLNLNVDYINKTMSKLDRIFNDYAHSNGIQYMYNHNIVNTIKQLIDCIQKLENVILIYAYYIDPLLLQSSDYLDNLEEGIEIEEYKYYVFQPALNVFERIKNSNPEYFEVLKNNNRYGMYIEENDYKTK